MSRPCVSVRQTMKPRRYLLVPARACAATTLNEPFFCVYASVTSSKDGSVSDLPRHRDKPKQVRRFPPRLKTDSLKMVRETNAYTELGTYASSSTALQFVRYCGHLRDVEDVHLCG